MVTPSSYKPSPLSHARSSPFRRPEPGTSPTPLRQTTPLASPLKLTSSGGFPGLSNSAGVTSTTTSATATPWTPKGRATQLEDTTPRSAFPPSPTRAPPASSTVTSHGNALSQLQTSQVRTLREGFQILDRDSDGIVNRDDVVDMLNQLGLPSGPSDVSQFFPPSAPQTMTMPLFLNSLSSTLAAMSPSAELLSAFSAFDDDDSGQIDLAELRDAVLNTAPEPGETPLTEAEVNMVMSGFTALRAFSRHTNTSRGGRNEVFKYNDFVNSVMGANGGSEANDAQD